MRYSLCDDANESFDIWPEPAAPETQSGDLIGREYAGRPFDNWLDEKIAAIGNLTPREAVKSPEGKRRLIDLLKEFENQNERAMRRGIKGPDAIFFPVEKIRKELGL